MEETLGFHKGKINNSEYYIDERVRSSLLKNSRQAAVFDNNGKEDHLIVFLTEENNSCWADVCRLYILNEGNE